MAVITASDYKTFKGISASTYDAQLAVIIPMAQSVAEKWCDRHFENASYIENISGSNWTRIVVANPPITSIDFITAEDAAGNSIDIDSDLYTFATDDSGVIGFSPAIEGATAVGRLGPLDTQPWINSPNFASGFKNIRVGYDGGYSTVPEGLKYAMIALVDAMLGSAIQPPGMMTFKGETLGNYKYENWTPEQRESFMKMYFGTWRKGKT